jgi:hypothetical protein
MLLPLALGLALGGCVRGCHSPRPPIHLNPNMDYQEKYQPMEESDFFYDGSTMREPVPGTVARDELAVDDVLHTGKDAQGEFVAHSPLPATDALLARGAQRFGIYCAPCHDARGNGTGILSEYGRVPTATFHDEQRRTYPDGKIFDVITNGSGLMKGYRWPIPPRDRWAIVAHVRRLQAEKMEDRVAMSMNE